MNYPTTSKRHRAGRVNVSKAGSVNHAYYIASLVIDKYREGHPTDIPSRNALITRMLAENPALG